MFTVPEFNTKFFCIANIEKPVLTSVVLSYVHVSGTYTPLFEFRKSTISYDESTEDQIDEHLKSRSTSVEFAARVYNALKFHPECEYLVLVGLTAEQLSYLYFLDNYNCLCIENISDVDFLLDHITDSKDKIDFLESNYREALSKSIYENKKLTISENCNLLDFENLDSSKDILVVCERTKFLTDLIAINYSDSINADIQFIEPPEIEKNEIVYYLEQWKLLKDENAKTALFDLINSKINHIDFSNYRIVTFFTSGIPYSLILENSLFVTHVNINLAADLFIFNNINSETINRFSTAIVFSPYKFGEKEETDYVIQQFRKENFYVRELTGSQATAHNLTFNVREFPFQVLHICSHGGEVSGYSIKSKFTDREGNVHTVEFDEVVGIAPDGVNEEIAVQSKKIWRKLDGYDWGSQELKNQNFPRYVFVDMIKSMNSEVKFDRVYKEKISNSCAIKCLNFNYQAMFNSLAANYCFPLVFNNTCWSWTNISTNFLYFGATSYIGTLWSIDNSIAKKSAERFYSEIEGTNIMSALYSTFDISNNSKDENVYLYWGTHFSSFPKGTKLDENKMRVADVHLGAFYTWRNRYKKSAEGKGKENLRRLMEWNFDQLLTYFKYESLVLTGKIPKKN